MDWDRGSYPVVFWRIDWFLTIYKKTHEMEATQFEIVSQWSEENEIKNPDCLCYRTLFSVSCSSLGLFYMTYNLFIPSCQITFSKLNTLVRIFSTDKNKMFCRLDGTWGINHWFSKKFVPIVQSWIGKHETALNWETLSLLF